MKLTIRTKLLSGFAILLILSSLIQAFAFTITRQYIYSQINNFQLSEAQRGANEIQNFFADINSINYGLAHAYKETIIASSSAQLPLITQYIINNNVYTKKITFLTPIGRELLKFDIHGQIPQDQLNYELFTDPFKTAAAGKTAISKVYFLDQALGPHIDIFSPIFVDNNSVVGVIKMQVDLEKLRSELEGIKYGDNGYIYVVDEEGRLIAHHSQKYVLERPNLSSRRIIELTSKNQIATDNDYTYNNEQDIVVVAKAVKIPGINWVAVFEQPESEAFGFLTFIRNLFIITLIGSSLLLLLIALFLSENLTSAIRKLQQSAQLVERGELDRSIVINTGDEIEALSHSFASMVNQLLQRERSLAREKQEIETMLQSLTDGVIAIDKNENIFLSNKVAQKIIGITNMQVLGKHIDTILHLYDETQRVPFSQFNIQTESMKMSLKEKGLSLITEDGRTIFLSITVSPIIFMTQKSSGWIITFHDITKEKELEEMKLDFVSMAAHELRTPLTSIRGYAALLEDMDFEKPSPDVKEYIKRLVINSDNLGDLIDNLLNVSRIERNTFKVETAAVYLLDIIQDVVDNLKEQAQLKNQHLLFQTPDKKMPLVLADSFRINQVLTNLVANSITFTPQGGSITITVEQKDNFLEVTVSDTGVGIPPEALPKLFTKFFRVSGALEQGSKGTGLGLFIAKSIITMHHGRIWVESAVGKGTAVRFTLPVASSFQIENVAYTASNSSLTGQKQQGIMINRDMFQKRFGMYSFEKEKSEK